MQAAPVQAWHDLVRSRDPKGLAAFLADDVVFHSPVVHKAVNLIHQKMQAMLQAGQ